VSPASQRPLRIAQVAPVAKPVALDAGDSVEQLVASLCEELVQRGHEVTLFATGDSRTSAELKWLHARGYDHDPGLWDWQFRESLHASFALEQAADFDVMHTHDYEFALPFFGFIDTPAVHTHHVEMGPDVIEAYARHPQVHLVAVSAFQRGLLGERRNVHTIGHGIDVAAFPFVGRGGDYLLFLGRMLADKGSLEAIETARRANLPLVMAGPDEESLYAGVAGKLDERAVTYVGEVGAAERNRLLANAAVLLYPLRYPEPFGLVMVEAMACGTPVAAVAMGAVPEIVDDGVTGYCVASWEELADVVPAARALDRRRVREQALARFDHRVTVDRHEELYRLVAGEGSP
jgi:glycosyltransferase involved in cell wall biosynthesis